MRFVATKTREQQSCLTLHRTRHLCIRQQTSVINAIRAHLAEFGIVAPVGRKGVEELLDVAADASDKRLPEVARACIAALGAQLRTLKAQIFAVRSSDHGLAPIQRGKPAARRYTGRRSGLATALVATVADPRAFRSGRNFSAWIGIVPKQHSSGGKDRLGSISKRGDRYLRGLFVAGASPSSATPRSMAPSIGPGSQHCWHDGRRRSPPSRSLKDGTDGLGDDGQGRALQGTCRACGVNEIAPDNRRDVKVGRTNST